MLKRAAAAVRAFLLPPARRALQRSASPIGLFSTFAPESRQSAREPSAPTGSSLQEDRSLGFRERKAA